MPAPDPDRLRAELRPFEEAELALVRHKPFQDVLSPMEILPGAGRLARAIQAAKGELHPDMPLLARLVRPFAPPG